MLNNLEIETRLHNGLGTEVCTAAINIVEAISQLPNGAIHVFNISDPFHPKLLLNLTNVSATINGFTLTIADGLTLDDYMVMGHNSYEGGLIIYMGDGNDIELIHADFAVGGY